MTIERQPLSSQPLCLGSLLALSSHQVAPLVAMSMFLGLVGVAAHKLQIDSIAQLLNMDNMLRLAAAVARELTALAEPVLKVAQSAVHLNPSTAGVVTMLWLLGMSVLCVPLVAMLPGGSPVLGFLIGGLLLGPHCLGIISDVHGVAHVAEFGVIFLLFNIGLELSLERLVSMAKYVFALGTAQVGIISLPFQNSQGITQSALCVWREPPLCHCLSLTVSLLDGMGQATRVGWG